MKEKFLLKNLHGVRLNDYSLDLGEIKQLRMSGWKGFKLYLKNPQGVSSTLPMIKGIYSTGGKDGVKPWMDLDYREELEFPEAIEGSTTLSLSSSKLDKKLFAHLGNRIPPGGHLMVSYEGEHKIHSDTFKSLSIGIPPGATPLGYLIFSAGFQYIKDWYLSEGGFEGPQKLWGEKAANETWAKNFYEKTTQQMRQFLEKNPSTIHKELEESARLRAKEILEILKK